MNDIALEQRAADIYRWIPFGFFAICLIIALGFWKINKSMEEPLPTVSEMQGSATPGGPGGPGAPPKSKMEGKEAPDFDLPTLAGGRMHLHDYRGKVLFLNFWATWCPPCRDEMPSMQKLHDHFKGRDFVMITISIDENISLIEPFMKELGLTFDVGLDPGQEISAKYGLTGVPETFLISPDGTVMHHLIGPGDWYEPGLVGALEGLVKRVEKARAEAGLPAGEEKKNRGY